MLSSKLIVVLLNGIITMLLTSVMYYRTYRVSLTS
jgi:hypothetical protein